MHKSTSLCSSGLPRCDGRSAVLSCRMHAPILLSFYYCAHTHVHFPTYVGRYPCTPENASRRRRRVLLRTLLIVVRLKNHHARALLLLREVVQQDRADPHEGVCYISTYYGGPFSSRVIRYNPPTPFYLDRFRASFLRNVTRVRLYVYVCLGHPGIEETAHHAVIVPTFAKHQCQRLS